MEKGKQIIDAINRLTQLSGTEGDSKIITLDKNAEAEKAGLREFLKNQLFEHAGFLMGCWFAVKNEYEPLCNTMASILNRAHAIQALRAKADSAAEAASSTTVEPAK